MLLLFSGAGIRNGPVVFRLFMILLVVPFLFFLAGLVKKGQRFPGNDDSKLYIYNGTILYLVDCSICARDHLNSYQRALADNAPFKALLAAALNFHEFGYEKKKVIRESLETLDLQAYLDEHPYMNIEKMRIRSDEGNILEAFIKRQTYDTEMIRIDRFFINYERLISIMRNVALAHPLQDDIV